ncbi:MAG: EAL domain-containing protein, partial [Solirubrobacteraceae bacterium]|nr:EAL domain-containing protein [Solirubrobacteraceae bacterium]
GLSWEGELDLPRKDGTTFRALMRTTAIRDERGDLQHLIGIFVDVTARHEMESELEEAREFLATITERMDEGVVTVNSDLRISYANASCARLLRCAPDDVVGRSLADFFIGDIEPLVEAVTRGATSRRDDACVRRADGHEIEIGWSCSPAIPEDPSSGGVIVFADNSEQRRRERALQEEVDALHWISRIQDGLVHGRFELHAQPIVDCASGETVQHELLIRLRGEDGALIPPGDFLPIAERHGLILDIDRWVIKQAAELLRRGDPLEINLSAESLSDPGLFGYLRHQLEAAGARPELLAIEVTETALLRDEDAVQAFIAQASGLGCQFALDDFGTGYGGFTYLKRLPVDVLKIDVEFVRELPTDEPSRHVVSAVLSLARGFGQQVIAEGVEDAATMALLREMGCDQAQGYFLGRPGPVAEALHRNGDG